MLKVDVIVNAANRTLLGMFESQEYIKVSATHVL